MTEVQLPSGVGRSAFFVTWTRMLESRRPDALFHDPVAEIALAELAKSAEVSEMAKILGSDRGSAATTEDEDRFAYFAVRTRYFDDRLLAATHRGIRQVVLLAAGMDGRAWRVDWPIGTTLYELDLPDIMEFKEAALATSGLTPRCYRRGVRVDLTADWGKPLLDAGFNAVEPTVWLAEGVLQYLTLDAGDAMLSRVTELSVAGSELLLEHNSKIMESEAGRSVREAVEASGVAWKSARDDLQPWLDEYGWRAEVHAGSDSAISHGRKVPRMPATWLAHSTRIG